MHYHNFFKNDGINLGICVFLIKFDTMIPSKYLNKLIIKLKYSPLKIYFCC